MGGKQSFPVESLPRERTVIVTGGNTGIGYETAKWIAIMGATVIIACRSEERALEAIERMRKEFPADKENLQKKGVSVTTEQLSVEFLRLDLMSIRSVLDFVEEFKRRHAQLHVLLCNAGIGMAPYKKTDDGFESIFQTNYLGHFLLISKLLPLMQASGDDCRVHLVSSKIHTHGSYNPRTTSYEGDPNSFSRMGAYARSKLFQIMQTYSMARRFKGTNVSITCSHPGVVDSEFARSFPDVWYYKAFYSVGKKVGGLISPFEGAKTSINAVVSPSLKGVSGVYFDACKPTSPSTAARNEETQEQLWQQTMEFLKPHMTQADVAAMEGQFDSTQQQQQQQQSPSKPEQPKSDGVQESEAQQGGSQKDGTKKDDKQQGEA